MTGNSILTGTCNVCAYRRVAAFVDIEAEASDDEAEEESSDEGDEEEATEADAMFVNDASPASIRSQPERGYALAGLPLVFICRKLLYATLLHQQCVVGMLPCQWT